MNRVDLVGRLVRNLELRQTSTGTNYVSFNLAVNDGKNNVEYIKCRAWNKMAEIMNKYLAKGNLISVEGKIHSYKTVKDDQTSYVTEIVVNKVDFLSTKKKAISKEASDNSSTKENDSVENNVSVETLENAISDDSVEEMDYVMSLTAEAELARNELQIDESDLPF